jgi:hypothetical protein
MASLTGNSNVAVTFNESGTFDLVSGSSQHRKSASLAWLSGSGAGQCSKIYSDSFSVSQSTNTDLDLSGSLAGVYGTVVFTAIKGILIVAGTNTGLGNLTVGNVTNGIVAPFGAATHSFAIAPGGVLFTANPSAAGFAITAGTADLLRIATAATAGTYTFDVVIWGI